MTDTGYYTLAYIFHRSGFVVSWTLHITKVRGLISAIFWVFYRVKYISIGLRFNHPWDRIIKKILCGWITILLSSTLMHSDLLPTLGEMSYISIWLLVHDHFYCPCKITFLDTKIWCPLEYSHFVHYQSQCILVTEYFPTCCSQSFSCFPQTFLLRSLAASGNNMASHSLCSSDQFIYSALKNPCTNEFTHVCKLRRACTHTRIHTNASARLTTYVRVRACMSAWASINLQRLLWSELSLWRHINIVPQQRTGVVLNHPPTFFTKRSSLSTCLPHSQCLAANYAPVRLTRS